MFGLLWKYAAYSLPKWDYSFSACKFCSGDGVMAVTVGKPRNSSLHMKVLNMVLIRDLTVWPLNVKILFMKKCIRMFLIWY